MTAEEKKIVVKFLKARRKDLKKEMRETIKARQWLTISTYPFLIGYLEKHIDLLEHSEWYDE